MGHRSSSLKRKRSAISGDRVLTYAQQLRNHADARVRALAMSVLRQRESAARRARREKKRPR